MTKVLGEILMDLSFGPLAGLAIGGKGLGVTDPELEVRLVGLINLGMTKLHTRFNLFSKEVSIRKVEGKTLYPLAAVHGDNYQVVEGETSQVRYIIDNASNPYQEDLIKVLSAYGPDSVDGTLADLPIDDAENVNSIFLPTYNVIQIPFGEEGDEYSFIYQANHPKFGLDNLNQNVYLPPSLDEALINYVGAKMFQSMNGEEHIMKGSLLMDQYETTCQRVENNDIAHLTVTTTNTKLETRGFK